VSKLGSHWDVRVIDALADLSQRGTSNAKPIVDWLTHPFLYEAWNLAVCRSFRSQEPVIVISYETGRKRS
jgi:hypothetical protein